MAKILFITNRDVLTSCGAFRLIKNRAENLFSIHGISTDFCVIQRKDRWDSPKREDINAGGFLEFVGYTGMDLLFSLLKFYRKIYEILKRNSYDAIIISEACLPLNLKRIKRLSKAPIYFDGHGASEDIFECIKDKKSMSYAIRRIAYKVDVWLLRRYLKIADGGIVVSKGMVDYYKNLRQSSTSFNYFKVPCATISSIQQQDYECYRKEYRNKFNINDKTLAFVYSGGIEPWQCVQETIDLFKGISESSGIDYRLYIFTYEPELVLDMVKGDKRIFVQSMKPTELVKALCAMDYAFLIREDTITNNVAFPNKFLEYVNARLYTISTPYVFDVAEQIVEYKVGCILNDTRDIQSLIKYMNDSDKIALSYDTVQAVIDSNSFKTTLKDFANQISRKN